MNISQKCQRGLTACCVFVFVLQMSLLGVWPTIPLAVAEEIGTGAGPTLAYCGDGLVNGSEECDDGNFIESDSCRNNCTLPAICNFDLDVVLVMDRSGSMGDSSRCDWWQFKCKNKPSCSLGYEWVKNITYNQPKSWCDARNQSAPHSSVWTEYNPIKIVAAKENANDFLSLLGLGDQSALVSFATNYTLDKQLSNNHAATQSSVNGLIATGATDIGDAIKLGNNELTSPRINPQAVPIMILLTDGMANKPSGPGYGEYAPDVAYALAQADVSAAAGIKIFTIGLGSDVNATMLLDIADKTEGNYYFAPTAAELNDIFNQIALDICRYGTIAGCKYADENNNGAIDQGEPTMPGWEINLTNEFNEISTEVTGPDGCYKFYDVPLGSYTLGETAPPAVIYSQTYPAGDYAIELTEEVDLTGYDFANYLPVCGNNLLDINYPGYADEECDDGNDVNADSCMNNCQLPICGDGFLSQNEMCDDGNISNNDNCLNDCTLPTCGDGYLFAGHELCDDNGQNGQVCTPAPGSSCTYCSSVCEPVTLTSHYCGDGLVDPGEECDGQIGVPPHYSCSATCQFVYEPYCGDGLVNNFLEECDDGNSINNDGCQNDCNLPRLCQFDLDVALVMDRSGSMGDSSRCDWWQLKCKNKPSCSLGYEWVKNITYNQTENWCQVRNQSAPHNSVYIKYDPVKIVANKEIANDILVDLSSGDQSALVSFASDAKLDKTLSNNHLLTASKVNSLVTVGATNIGDAIKLGVLELTSISINPEAEQIMILFTDGKANKPAGPGYGEYAPDVAYALAEAGAAATAGIKIFTIGLDSEINAVMLGQIADLTGGEYYFAPTAEFLDDIYALLWPDICESGPYCGDGVKNNLEECDGTDGIGLYEICTDTCALVTPGVCGDNVVNQLAEQCDDGNQDNEDTCLNNCTLPTCGDGYVWSGLETCDDGNILNNDGCSSVCETEIVAPYCGDGIINGTEECDDGNYINDDSCPNSCTLPPVYGSCVDSDYDGYGAGDDRLTCLYPELDCDDSNDGVNPGALEICADGVDNDCDGDIDSADSDCVPVEPIAGDVLINEVAWMGMVGLSADEWLELRNTTGAAVDLTGWTINADDGTPAITLTGVIPANGYYLLERTDDTTVPSIPADQIYSGALEDSGEILVLRDSLSNIIDIAVESGVWPAGNGATKQTMERYIDLSWHDSALPQGTPKAANGG